MLLAGGQGSRLGALTRNIAKPAVPFGGKYRIIDFSLSNCTNSNIDTVGVLTQYKPFILNSYIGTGSAWDLDHAFGGVNILPPIWVRQKGVGIREQQMRSTKILILSIITILTMSLLFLETISIK